MDKHKVIIYSTTTCPYCVMAKDWFKKQGVVYEDKNVGLDHMAGKEMIEKSGQMGVPVVQIDDNIIVGFQPEVFISLLK